MIASLRWQGPRRRSWSGGGCVRRAGAIASALGLLLLALAACSESMAPAPATGDGSPPPGRQSPVVVTIAAVADSVAAGDPLQFASVRSPHHRRS